MTVRICTVALFLAATVLASSAPIPGDLPAIALGQSIVYRLEILLALVYGGLLLLTPLFMGSAGVCRSRSRIGARNGQHMQKKLFAMQKEKSLDWRRNEIDCSQNLPQMESCDELERQ
jgi:hypothetical protein